MSPTPSPCTVDRLSVHRPPAATNLAETQQQRRRRRRQRRRRRRPQAGRDRLFRKRVSLRDELPRDRRNAPQVRPAVRGFHRRRRLSSGNRNNNNSNNSRRKRRHNRCSYCGISINQCRRLRPPPRPLPSRRGRGPRGPFQKLSGHVWRRTELVDEIARCRGGEEPSPDRGGRGWRGQVLVRAGGRLRRARRLRLQRHGWWGQVGRGLGGRGGHKKVSRNERRLFRPYLQKSDLPTVPACSLSSPVKLWYSNSCCPLGYCCGLINKAIVDEACKRGKGIVEKGEGRKGSRCQPMRWGLKV